jgi:hypothetical protein
MCRVREDLEEVDFESGEYKMSIARNGTSGVTLTTSSPPTVLGAYLLTGIVMKVGPGLRDDGTPWINLQAGSFTLWADAPSPTQMLGLYYALNDGPNFPLVIIPPELKDMIDMADVNKRAAKARYDRRDRTKPDPGPGDVQAMDTEEGMKTFVNDLAYSTDLKDPELTPRLRDFFRCIVQRRVCMMPLYSTYKPSVDDNPQIVVMPPNFLADHFARSGDSSKLTKIEKDKPPFFYRFRLGAQFSVTLFYQDEEGRTHYEPMLVEIKNENGYALHQALGIVNPLIACKLLEGRLGKIDWPLIVNGNLNLGKTCDDFHRGGSYVPVSHADADGETTQEMVSQNTNHFTVFRVLTHVIRWIRDHSLRVPYETAADLIQAFILQQLNRPGSKERHKPLSVSHLQNVPLNNTTHAEFFPYRYCAEKNTLPGETNRMVYNVTENPEFKMTPGQASRYEFFFMGNLMPTGDILEKYLVDLHRFYDEHTDSPHKAAYEAVVEDWSLRWSKLVPIFLSSRTMPDDCGFQFTNTADPDTSDIYFQVFAISTECQKPEVVEAMYTYSHPSLTSSALAQRKEYIRNTVGNCNINQQDPPPEAPGAEGEGEEADAAETSVPQKDVFLTPANKPTVLGSTNAPGRKRVDAPARSSEDDDESHSKKPRPAVQKNLNFGSSPVSHSKASAEEYNEEDGEEQTLPPSATRPAPASSSAPVRKLPVKAPPKKAKAPTPPPQLSDDDGAEEGEDAEAAEDGEEAEELPPPPPRKSKHPPVKSGKARK